MITRDYAIQFEEIMKEVVTPIFAEDKFKKNKYNFYRKINDIVQIFSVQKSRWNSKDEISFTFNIGLINENIYREINNKEVPLIPREYDSDVRARLGTLSRGIDYWYTLNNNTNIPELKKEIENDIRNFAIPVFEKFTSLDSWLGLLDDKKFYIYDMIKFLLFINLGKKERSITFLNEMYKKALIPESSISTLIYPDGTREETKSEPTTNQSYINSIKDMALKYKIRLN